MPVSMLKLACLAISFPWSEVMVRKNSPGNLATAPRMAVDLLRFLAVGQVQQKDVPGGPRSCRRPRSRRTRRRCSLDR